MNLRDALDVKVGSTPVNKIYKGTYKVWDKNRKVLEGYCKQGDLPSEYQQVEYIESTGTQYIDTNVNADYKLSVLAEFSLTEFGNAFGAIGSASGLGNRHHFNFTSNQGIRYYYTGTNVNTVQLFSPGEELGIKHKYFIDIYNSKVQIDDGTLENIDTRSEFDIGINYWLFRRNANSDSLKTYSKIKLYNFKMYKENVLVRNFIPCYRKSDSVIGLYDTINNVFYTNDGTGTFGKGSDVPDPNYEQPIEVMQGRQTIEIKGQQYIVDLKSKNLLNLENMISSTTLNGIEFVNNGNDTFNVSGTATANANLVIADVTEQIKKLQKNKNYYFYSSTPYNLTNFNLTLKITTSNSGTKYFTSESAKLLDENWNITQAVVVLWVGNGNTVTTATNVKTMLVQSDVIDNNYEPYYDYKLAGIGDVKDNIYTDKGKWYFKQNIGNVVLNGGNDEEYVYQNNARFWLKRSYWNNETVPINPTNRIMGLYCNRFIERDRGYTWDGVEGISYDNPNTTLEPIGSSFDIACNSVATTAEAFKTWLSTHNLDIWYLLQNPQITEIPSTYTTLINQLNALYQAI